MLASGQRRRWARRFVSRTLIKLAMPAHRRRWTTSFSRCMELGFRRQSDGNVQPHANCLQASYYRSARRRGWREGCSGHGGEFGRCALVLFSFLPFILRKFILSFTTQFEAQPGQVAYAATKGALVSMTLPMARDLESYGIRVVTIAPGAFITPMLKLMKPKAQESISRNLLFPSRMGEPREFGQTVKWILECAYVNGETIRLSGGSRLPAKM